MPELPEVETIKRDLSNVLIGRRVSRFLVSKTRLLKSSKKLFISKLVGSKILSVDRRAKLLLLNLSSGYTVLIHLKMTGQLVYQRASGKLKVGGHPIVGVDKIPNKYTYITLSLDNKAKLFFNDVRQFGYWQIIDSKELDNKLSHFGPEPLSKNFTAEAFYKRLQSRRRTSIKAAILDQKIVSGIGNIYADESLFVARLYPGRLVGSLTSKETRALFLSIKQVLRKSINARGTSFNSYRDGLGRTGTYWEKRLVYGRTSQACPRCGKIIKKLHIAGRGTHFCPNCQK